MEEWKKVAYFADGVIYACGNKCKIVTPGNPDIYYEVQAQEAIKNELTSLEEVESSGGQSLCSHRNRGGEDQRSHQ